MTKQTRVAAPIPRDSAAAFQNNAFSPAEAPAEAPTLRDHLAMRAPSAPSWWINAYMQRTEHPVIDARALAEWAYEYADAAMVERAK